MPLATEKTGRQSAQRAKAGAGPGDRREGEGGVGSRERREGRDLSKPAPARGSECSSCAPRFTWDGPAHLEEARQWIGGRAKDALFQVIERRAEEILNFILSAGTETDRRRVGLAVSEKRAQGAAHDGERGRCSRAPK